MKWKDGVKVIKEKQYRFEQESNSKEILDKYRYIVDAVDSGIENDYKLVKIIEEKEKTSDVEAGLELANFLIEYGDFIGEMEGHILITT